MSESSSCPNCNADIKKNAFSSNSLLSENDRDIINEYSDEVKEGYCEKCALSLYQYALIKLKKEGATLKEDLRNLIRFIPILTIQNLPNWEYDILEMVTGQSTTGTGAITEFTSSFTDFFGQQSKRHNIKLKAGEELCMAQLREQTIELGGNAIIGTDIDYADAGGGKGMLIVCMSGTAIFVKNNIFSKEQVEGLKLLDIKKKRLKYLSGFKFYE